MESSFSVIKIHDQKKSAPKLALRALATIFSKRMCVCGFFSGIAGQRLLRPYFLPQLLTGALDHDCIRIILSDLSQDVEVKTKNHLWFMRDGSLPCFLVEFPEFGNTMFPEQ